MAGRIDERRLGPGFRASLARLLSTLMVFAGTTSALADELPLWARRTSRALTPHWAASAPVVQLFDDTRVTVRQAGRVIVLRRGVVRILGASDAPEGFGTTCLAAGRGDVLSARAWRVGGRGDVSAVRVSLFTPGTGTDADSSRAGRYCLRISPHEPLHGSVYAWEIVTEDDLLLTRWTHAFSRPIPVVESHFAIVLPTGVEPVTRLALGDGVLAVHVGREWSWTVHGLAACPFQLLETGLMQRRPMLFVAMRGTEGSPGAFGSVAFATAPSADPRERLGEIVEILSRLSEPGRDPGLGHGWDMRPQRLAVVMSDGFGGESHQSAYARTSSALFDRRAWLIGAASRRREAPR